MIELIVSDCDGTLLTDEVKVLHETAVSVKRAMAAGVRFAIATGRFKRGVKAILDGLGVSPEDISVAYDNGGYLEINGKPVMDDSLDSGTLLRILEFSSSFDCCPVLYYGDNWFVESRGRWYDNLDRFYPGLGSVRNLRDVLAERDSGEPMKMVVRADVGVMGEMIPPMTREFPEIDTFYSNSNILEMVRHGCGKEKAVAAMAAHFGIALENVMTIGDYDNDLGMIKIAGLGVAMRNSSESLRKACGFVTLSNNENGVGYAIDKFAGGDPA